MWPGIRSYVQRISDYRERSPALSEDFGVTNDQFTEVTTQGYGSRLGNSISGMLFGFVMVIASFILLYWNEGRAVEAMQALSRGAKAVIEVAATRVDPSANGKLVHLSGPVSTVTPARDPMFGVTAPGLLRLQRTVEMYQWKEETHSETHKSIGGTKTTRTTYTYSKGWSSTPINSSQFHHPDGHANPPMPLQSETFNSATAKLGVYTLGVDVLEQISAFTSFSPGSSTTLPAGWTREGEMFFHGSGNTSNPTVGDTKVSYTAIPARPISVVAADSGGTLTTYHDSTGYPIVLAALGVASSAELFHAKQRAENHWTWILRGVGFLVMLFGFMLIARPLSVVLAVVPLLEGIASAGTFLIALFLALPLTILVIAVAWVSHRPFVGVGLIVLAVAAFVLIRQLRARPKTA